MNQTLQNSYLQRYEHKQQSRDSRAMHKSITKSPLSPPQMSSEHSLPAVVSKLEQRVDGIDVKMTSLLNVVKLLQKYTETRDDQYQKQKQNELIKRSSVDQSGHQSAQLQLKLKQFDLLSRQFKDELKNVERLKSNLVINQMQSQHQNHKLQGIDSSAIEDRMKEMQDRMREQINKKMQICVKLINTNTINLKQKVQNGLIQKVNTISFNLNQLENECRRNRMMLQKQIDSLSSMIKDNSTAIPHHSRVTQRQVQSRSPNRVNLTHNKSKNQSDKSLSKGKQNKSAVIVNLPKETSKIKQQEMRQALRKKREHREKLKVHNF